MLNSVLIVFSKKLSLGSKTNFLIFYTYSKNKSSSYISLLTAGNNSVFRSGNNSIDAKFGSASANALKWDKNYTMPTKL